MINADEVVAMINRVADSDMEVPRVTRVRLVEPIERRPADDSRLAEPSAAVLRLPGLPPLIITADERQ